MNENQRHGNLLSSNLKDKFDNMDHVTSCKCSMCEPLSLDAYLPLKTELYEVEMAKRNDDAYSWMHTSLLEGQKTHTSFQGYSPKIITTKQRDTRHVCNGLTVSTPVCQDSDNKSPEDDPFNTKSWPSGQQPVNWIKTPAYSNLTTDVDHDSMHRKFDGLQKPYLNDYAASGIQTGLSEEKHKDTSSEFWTLKQRTTRDVGRGSRHCEEKRKSTKTLNVANGDRGSRHEEKRKNIKTVNVATTVHGGQGNMINNLKQHTHLGDKRNITFKDSVDKNDVQEAQRQTLKLSNKAEECMHTVEKQNEHRQAHMTDILESVEENENMKIQEVEKLRQEVKNAVTKVEELSASAVDENMVQAVRDISIRLRNANKKINALADKLMHTHAEKCKIHKRLDSLKSYLHKKE